MNAPDEFDEMMGQAFRPETIDNRPYGTSHQPVKTGLTTRGKAAVAFGGAALLTGSLIGWMHYSASEADSQVKAEEIAYKKDLLELEKLKVQGEVNKTQASTQTARQKHIDACVQSNKDLVGKTLSSGIRDIVDACQAQYAAGGSNADLQPTASSHDGGGVNGFVLIGGSVLAIGVVVLVKKGARSNAA